MSIVKHSKSKDKAIEFLKIISLMGIVALISYLLSTYSINNVPQKTSVRDKTQNAGAILSNGDTIPVKVIK